CFRHEDWCTHAQIDGRCLSEKEWETYFGRYFSVQIEPIESSEWLVILRCRSAALHPLDGLRLKAREKRPRLRTPLSQASRSPAKEKYLRQRRQRYDDHN